MKLNIFAVILIAIISGCSQGDKNNPTKNDKVPTFSNKNMEYVEVGFKKDVHIDLSNYDKARNSINAAVDFTVDGNGNIYILDILSSSVFKFTPNGELQSSFCRKGAGPGEAVFPSTILAVSDTVFVTSNRTREILAFDTDGNFIKTNKYMHSIPSAYSHVNGNYLGFAQEFADDEMYFNLNLYSPRFEKLKCLNSYQVDLSDEGFFNNYLDIFPPFGVSENNIFVSDNDNNIYSIKAYDSSGEQIYKLTKKYGSIVLTPEENIKMVEQTKYIEGDEPIKEFRNRYKKPVNYIIPESDRVIWVSTSKKRTGENENYTYIDVFEEGCLIRQYKTDGLYFQEFNYDNLKYRIVNKKLYEMTPDSLSVYDISRM